MPGLVRKLLVFAAADGLVLQPLLHKGQRPAPAVKVGYDGAAIGPALDTSPSPTKAFEAFGVVGLLRLSNSSYLISITRRKLVAYIHGKPVFVVTEVALTPLSSRREAETAVEHTQSNLQRCTIEETTSDGSESEDDDGEHSAAGSDNIEDEDPAGLSHATVDGTVKGTRQARRSSIAEDVITRKGGYGLFTQKWFSGRGWTVNQRRNLGMSATDPESPIDARTGSSTGAASAVNQRDQPPEVAGSVTESDGPSMPSQRDIATTLLPKLLRTTRLLFGSSRSFFFSYDYDITRAMANQNLTRGSDIPLHRDVDPSYFWNRHVIQPFIDAGQHSYVLPLMQGFVGQRTFTVEKNPAVKPYGDDASSSMVELKQMSPEVEHEPSKARTDHGDSFDRSEFTEATEATSILENIKPENSHASQVEDTRSFHLTLISRRSVKRAGLRYLRRGVDDDGNSANSVETEQILSSTAWLPTAKTHSFVQVRGSIPLFFSQSPYSFKPIPQLLQSEDANFRALKRHFANLSARYGSVQVASLVEKHGVEAQIGEEYKKQIDRLNLSGGVDNRTVGFEWFDFHAMCRGMKFENVSLLLDELGTTLDSFGATVEVESQLVSKQSGILRTNCMDCLDRTNVVQSACGRRALENQLNAEGFDLSLQTDQTTEWFNTLWADNGDAISKQYASTSALKGDFTRTRKRNLKGALTDMGLSISRFYTGIVNDYFSQAAIDFLLGNVTSLVFEDFESNLVSGDPAVSMRKVRQQAIEVSQRVIADETEDLIGGWAFLTPLEPNTIKSDPFEEAVLLLTDAALYACRFDWNMEKVSSFERVDLRHITSIKYGTYITSTLSPSQADDKRNVGLTITYCAGINDITRVNTRSLSTHLSRGQGDVPHGTPVISFPGLLSGKAPASTKMLAFKALPARSAVAGEQLPAMTMSELEQIRHVCGEIERMVGAGMRVDGVEARGKLDEEKEKEKEEVGKGKDETEKKEKGKRSLVNQGDIISLIEARKSTGLLEQLGHSLKKLVWA